MPATRRQILLAARIARASGVSAKEVKAGVRLALRLNGHKKVRKK